MQLDAWVILGTLKNRPARKSDLDINREAVRQSAEETLQDFANRCGLAALLPGLLSTLHITKVPRVICMTMQWFCALAEVSSDSCAPDRQVLRSDPNL